MEGMTFLGFVLITAVGIGVPAIVLELLSPMRQKPAVREAQDVAMSVQPAEAVAAAIPAFFARPTREPRATAAFGFDDAMLALLQNHVNAERAVAKEFVHFPSVDSLYARPSLTMH